MQAARAHTRKSSSCTSANTIALPSALRVSVRPRDSADRQPRSGCRLTGYRPRASAGATKTKTKPERSISADPSQPSLKPLPVTIQDSATITMP